MSQPPPAPAAVDAARPDDEEPPPPPVRHGRLRRLAPLLVGIGVAAVASPLAERWPSTHDLEISLEEPALITQVTVTAGVAGHEPVLATTWSFAAGDAPERLRTTVHGPDGPYEIVVEIARDARDLSSKVHRVDLGGQGRAIVHAR